MFFTTFKMRILTHIRNYPNLFWTLLFPLGLATLYYFTIGGLDEELQFQQVSTGIVKDEAYSENELFDQVIQGISGSLIEETVYSSENEAKEALHQGEIAGYFLMENGIPTLSVKSNGISQTILKGFLDQYLVMETSAIQILTKNPSASLEELFSISDLTESISLTNASPSSELSYFYAMVAMSCLYGSYLGLDLVVSIQGNLSALGARRCIAAGKRLLPILADFAATVLMEFCSMALLVLYLQNILGIILAENLFWLFITIFAGSFLGVLSGAVVGSLNRFRYGTKNALLTIFTMVCSFLAGLMTQNMAYIVREQAPAIAFLNPAARISDALYCLYYYGANGRFFENLAYLILVSLLFFSIILFSLRRQRYESI